MKLYGITEDQLIDAIAKVSHDSYERNLTANIVRHKTYLQWTLRVQDSRGPGAHRAASGRRTCSACWHAHFDVMQAIFLLNPDAKIVTAMARYDGIEDFLAKYRATGDWQVGSRMQPASYGDLCECERHVNDQPTREVTERLRAKGVEKRRKARAKRWRRTGVSEATVRWMEERDML